jgi:hypothetical protein
MSPSEPSKARASLKTAENYSTTFSIKTHSITTLGIMTFSIVINKTRHSAFQHSANGRALLCRVQFILSVTNEPFMMKGIMLNFIMLSVIMLSVIMLSVIMLTVIYVECHKYNHFADFRYAECR